MIACAENVGQRILSAKADEVNTFTKVGAERQVIAPGPVDLEQHHDLFCSVHRLFAHGLDKRQTTSWVARPDVRSVSIVQDVLSTLHHSPMLFVGDRGVFRDRPSDLEVLAFYNPLCPCDLAAHEGVIDRRVARLRQEARGNQVLEPVSDQQLVFEADEGPRFTWVALSAGTALELLVHPSALVSIRRNHVQSAKRHDPIAIRRVLPS